MNRRCHQFKPDQAPTGDLIDLVWRIFVRHEMPDRSTAPEGIGELMGDRFYLKFVVERSSGFFTFEVLDKLRHECWQLCVSPTSGGRRVVSSSLIWTAPPSEVKHGSLLDEIWNAVFSERVMTDSFTTKADPHFMATVGAAISPAGITSLSDDAAQIASLTHDLEYWRELAKVQARELKERTLSLKTVPAVVPGEKESTPPPSRTWRLDELDQWAAEHSDQIVVLPRAIAAAKRSNYENPELVFDCLDMLAKVYPKVKTGELDRNAFKNRAEELGLNFGGSVDLSNAGERGEYFVRWGGRRRFLDQHLTKGSARDPRFSMRIYFTYCSDAKMVVVGWLPSHLGTSRT